MESVLKLIESRKLEKRKITKKSKDLLNSAMQVARILKEIGLEQPVSCFGNEDQWNCPWEICHEFFTSVESFTNHILRVHNTRPYACDFGDCKWTFPTKAKLLRHKMAHEDKKNWMCSYPGCEKTFKNKSNMLHHKNVMHETKPTLQCPNADCDAVFRNKLRLECHLKEHNQPIYRCQVEACGKTFFTNNALCTHMRRHEYKEDELKCKLCGKEFQVPCRLRLHMQSHGSDRPYRCNEPGCDWSFISQSKLNRHMDKHLQNRQFPCTFPGCSKNFLRKQHLEAHMKTHEKVTVYHCPVASCSTLFDNRKLLQLHIAQNHNQTEKAKILNTEQSNRASVTIAAENSVSSNSSSFFGSARTSLTYVDIVHKKKKQGDEREVRDNIDVENSTVVPMGEMSHLRDGAQDVSLCATELDVPDILHSDHTGTVQQDLMLGGASLNDPPSLIMQDELLTQEYFLLMESNNRLPDFEPSTINLRDLE